MSGHAHLVEPPVVAFDPGAFGGEPRPVAGDPVPVGHSRRRVVGASAHGHAGPQGPVDIVDVVLVPDDLGGDPPPSQVAEQLVEHVPSDAHLDRRLGRHDRVPGSGPRVRASNRAAPRVDDGRRMPDQVHHTEVDALGAGQQVGPCRVLGRVDDERCARHLGDDRVQIGQHRAGAGHQGPSPGEDHRQLQPLVDPGEEGDEFTTGVGVPPAHEPPADLGPDLAVADARDRTRTAPRPPRHARRGSSAPPRRRSPAARR